MQNSLNLDCLLKPNAVHLTENAGEFSDRPLRNTWRAHFMERRLNEAAAAADASRGLTGQLRCPKTKSAYHVGWSIEYPYKQLQTQTQGRLPSNGPIRSDPALKILLRPWSFLRRVTPDRVLAFLA